MLENRLSELLPYSIDDVLDEISDPERAAGGGSAAALAGAMASALGVLTSRLMKIDPVPFLSHREFFRAASEGDAQAFAGLMHSPHPTTEALVEATETPLRIAERAQGLHGDLQRIALALRPAIPIRCNHGNRARVIREIGSDRNRRSESGAPFWNRGEGYAGSPAREVKIETSASNDFPRSGRHNPSVRLGCVRQLLLGKTTAS